MPENTETIQVGPVWFIIVTCLTCYDGCQPEQESHTLQSDEDDDNYVSEPAIDAFVKTVLISDCFAHQKTVL